MRRENPEDEFALILQGARAHPHCPAAWVGAPCVQCHGPELGRGLGGDGWDPDTLPSSPGDAQACHRDGGRPPRQLRGKKPAVGGPKAAGKPFADFPPAAACVPKQLFPALPKRQISFQGIFIK